MTVRWEAAKIGMGTDSPTRASKLKAWASKVPEPLRRFGAACWEVLLSFDRSAGTRQAAQLSFFAAELPGPDPARGLDPQQHLRLAGRTPDLIREIINNLPIEEIRAKEKSRTCSMS